ncbi:MAG: ferritin-like domain-containing protein [Bdellovibrionia bacterium]
MEQTKKLGMNKTGIDMAPIESKKMIQGTEELSRPRVPQGDQTAVSQNRIRMIKESEYPVGSVPMPGTMKGALKTGMQMLQGNDAKILIDKLGERLAFERAGVRLYDALISKHLASEDQAALPPIDRIQEIRNEELRHFHLVADVMRQLGADPTAQTPSADVIGVASMGIQKVATEARMGFSDTLCAILTAELTDNAGWTLLIQLAQEAGLKDAVTSFQEALAREQEHLESVQSWVQEITLSQMRMKKQAA